MAVEGTLELFKLPEILEVVAQQRETGILVVQGQEDIVAISFLNGQIVAADALNQTLEEGLAQVLVDEHQMAASEFARIVADYPASGLQLVDFLVERQYLSRPELLRVLRMQATRMVEQLLTWVTGEFKFYSGEEVLYEEGFIPIPVDELFDHTSRRTLGKLVGPRPIPKESAQVPPSASSSVPLTAADPRLGLKSGTMRRDLGEPGNFVGSLDEIGKHKPRVFLSYSHDSSEHMEKVLALCNRLRSDGVDAWVDQYEVSPLEGWPRWSERLVREAEFVVVVGTATYVRRFHGTEEVRKGRGVRWEGYVIAQELYDAGARNERFIPVLLPPVDEQHIPLPLRGATHYDLSREEGYWRLYRHLTRQPEIEVPALGKIVPLPPRERRADFDRPAPQYPDRTRDTAERLIEARRRLKELTVAGQDTWEVRSDILRLRRERREGRRLQPGDVLAEGGIQLVEVLGRGGFATVWKAWDDERERLVAIKVLHSPHVEDRSRLERFFRGARKMAELQHPGIVRVLEDHVQDGDYYYFVMELVEGEDLQKAVLSGKLPPEQVVSIILKVGEALAYAHRQGVIHRDVKPANILLAPDCPKLTDFDLVHAQDTTGGTRTQGMGTFLYTAPEILNNARDVTVAADVYSLAMTTVFALFGRDLPIDVLRRPERIIEALPCAPGVREVLLQAISWAPTDRPASIGEFCGALRARGLSLEY